MVKCAECGWVGSEKDLMYDDSEYGNQNVAGVCPCCCNKVSEFHEDDLMEQLKIIVDKHCI